MTREVQTYEWDSTLREPVPSSYYLCECGGELEQCDDEHVCPTCEPERYEHKCDACGSLDTEFVTVFLPPHGDVDYRDCNACETRSQRP